MKLVLYLIKHFGTPKEKRSEMTIENVFDDVQEDPIVLLKKRSSQLPISVRSLGRIMKRMEFHDFHPYKVQLTHKLEITDLQKHPNLARTFLQHTDAHDYFT